MNKLEQIKCLCDLMTDTKCEIDRQQKVANIDFLAGNSRVNIRVFADEAKEDLEDYLEEAKNMIKCYESIAVKLEALLLLKVVKN